MFRETSRVPARRLGRRPPTNKRALVIDRYLTGVVPPHPISVDYLAAVPRWMLGGNDQFGTCGPTDVANSAVLVYKVLLNEDITVSDEAVFKLYRASGNPNFDPNLGPDDPRQEDKGVDMQTMYEALLKVGIDITHADGTVENIVPAAFAKIGDLSNFDIIRACTDLFGVASFGVNLEVAQQAQTDAGLWDYRSSAEWGGHAVPGGKYTSKSGRGQADERVVSWQRLVDTTDAFMSHQLEEAWVVVWKPLLSTPGFDRSVKQAALAADYQAMTGRPFPVPVPPAPPAPPAPTPPPPPSNVWHWLEQEAETLPPSIRDFVEGILHYLESQYGMRAPRP